ncbi:alpha/beta fold hydrolase [Mycolicibacterium goodii]|uniref:alpha/beta fold hydrolase n=1 Tax=Mycolicibacterium goodii TaxID=134601 RepID=UPI000C2601B5|nr:alpha/beta hydrolase [Mycolicibacterium goodii]PJK20081.1 alpha/beta hydrolase [Mycolicibacterium goodii]
MTEANVEHFATQTHGSGPGLVLSHGGGGGIDLNFGPILPTLADHFTVVGPDFPGSGSTPRSTSPLTLDGLADGLVASAAAAGLDRFSLVGYSMGTSVAIRTAARHSDRVDKMVLIAGFARPDSYLRLALDLWEAMLDGAPEVLAKFLLALGGGDQMVSGLDRAEVDRLVATMAESIPAGAADHVALAKTIDVRADLPLIEAPTLVIKTTLDRLATPAHSDELAAGIPSARSVELDCGHSVAAERPARLAKLIIDHLTT